MKRLKAFGTASTALALLLSAATFAQERRPEIKKTNLKIGDQAPDFTLRDQDRKEWKLSDFRGKKNVVLAFYVLAFTGG